MRRRRRLWRLLAIAIAIVLALWGPRPASGHALLERASPTPGSIQQTAPTRVLLWFTEDLSPASKIIVWDRFRHDVTTAPATIVPGQTRELEAGLRALPAGSYLVLWTSVSADDGHVLHGSYVFSVKRLGPLPSLSGVSLGTSGQSFPDNATLAALLAHWLELLAAVTWTGTVAFGIFVFGPGASQLDCAVRAAEERRRIVLVRASLGLLILASAALILIQAYQVAGNDWSGITDRSTWRSVFSIQYGRLWIGRQGLALLALLGTLPLGSTRQLAGHPLLRSPSPVGRSRPTSSFRMSPPPDEPDPTVRPAPASGAFPLLILGALYLYLLAASGHGASAAIEPVGGTHLLSLSVGADWLHLIADALWFGGQIYIAIALIPALGLKRAFTSLQAFLAALNRFSPVAYTSIAFYILSGVFAADVHIPSWYAFLYSVYGRTLMVKVVLIGLMMLTSMLTVYVLRPRIRRVLSLPAGRPERARLPAFVEGLLFWLRVNPVLGLGVLLATSVLYYYPVPYGFGPPPPSSYTVSGQGITASIGIKPGSSGPNRFTVALDNAQHRPITVATVRVLGTMLDMVMGTNLIVLNPTKTGTFSGTTDLGMGGRWRFVLLVYLPSGTLVRLPVDTTISS